MNLELEKFRRLFKRYPEVFRGKNFKFDEFKQVYEQTNGYSDLTVFYYDKDIIHYIIAALVMKEKKYLDINFMNAYQLIDIYLGNIEELPCLSVITNDVIAIYDGVGMPNKQKGNILIQVIEQQRMAGRKFWLFYKGNASRLNSMYPEVMEIIKDDNFSVIEYHQMSKRRLDDEEDII